jgi:hypothetical protein
MVLGVGQDVEVLDFDSWTTKKAKDSRDAARAAGKIPMLVKDHDEATAMADSVKQHDTAGALFSAGDPEVSMFAPDPGYGIWRRGRLDWFTQVWQRHTVVDFKTSADVSPDHFARSIADFGYHTQQAHYSWLLADLLNCDSRDIDFMWVVVPTVPPYLPQIYRLDPADIDRGRDLCLRAYEKYRDCTASGFWPDWSQERADEIGELSLPAYARIRIQRELDNDY